MESKMRTELLDILDCIRDGIFITDGNANVLVLNRTSELLSQYSRENLLDKNVEDLIQAGYFKKSEVVSLKCIASKREESLIQKGVDENHEILVTGVPLIRNGQVEKVVVTERDISQLNHLENALRENKRLAEKYKKELEYFRSLETEIAQHIVCESRQMQQAVRLASKVAKQDTTVLIQGESGTGKEVIAKFIYKSSLRKDKPFIKINCGAIPENLLESELFGYEKGAFTGASEKGKIGLFELANEGTLFLDEVGTLAPHLQVKLLRVLQEKEIMRVGGNACIPIDVRILAATNSNLKEAMEKGEFRSDLYYRLNVVPIFIEPLRNRKADIRPLAEKFLAAFNQKYNAAKELSESAWKQLLSYSWPGNVRELENFIERLVVISECDLVDARQLSEQFSFPSSGPTFIPIGSTLKQKVEEYEKRLILSQLPYYSRTQDLANSLGIDKSTLTRKMKRYQINLK